MKGNHCGSPVHTVTDITNQYGVHLAPPGQDEVSQFFSTQCSKESLLINWRWHIRWNLFAITGPLSAKCLINLIQFSQQIHEIKINFNSLDKKQRRVSMIKELDQVHKGTKSWAENSDPSRSDSKVHTLVTLPCHLPSLCICPATWWAFAGPLLPAPHLQTPCIT